MSRIKIIVGGVKEASPPRPCPLAGVGGRQEERGLQLPRRLRAGGFSAMDEGHIRGKEQVPANRCMIDSDMSMAGGVLDYIAM